MPSRSKDWMAQAEVDYQYAQSSAQQGRHEWACFIAQQASEKAVKALHLHLGQEAWGHTISKLLKELPIQVSPEIIEQAKVLDNHYVPTRYVNGHPEGAPFEHYGPIQSKEALEYAGKILKFTRAQMAK